MELAEQIAALRKKHGFSQEELGEKLGVSRQAAVSYTHLDVYKRQILGMTQSGLKLRYSN